MREVNTDEKNSIKKCDSGINLSNNRVNSLPNFQDPREFTDETIFDGDELEGPKTNERMSINE